MKVFIRNVFIISCLAPAAVMRWGFSLSCACCGGGLLRPALPRAPSWAVFFMVL